MNALGISPTPWSLSRWIEELVEYELETSTQVIGLVVSTNQPINDQPNIVYTGNSFGPPSTFLVGSMRGQDGTSRMNLNSVAPATRFWSNRGWNVQEGTIVNGSFPFNPSRENTDQASVSIRLHKSTSEVSIRYRKILNDQATVFDVNILGFYPSTKNNGILIYGTYGDFGGFITISLWEALFYPPPG